jgi:hypothetical protein
METDRIEETGSENVGSQNCIRESVGGSRQK